MMPAGRNLNARQLALLRHRSQHLEGEHIPEIEDRDAVVRLSAECERCVVHQHGLCQVAIQAAQVLDAGVLRMRQTVRVLFFFFR